MSDTPRTDLNTWTPWDREGKSPDDVVYAEVSRTLERELTAAQARIAELEAQAKADAEDGWTLADNAVKEELEKAVRKFPTWPTDPLHAVAVLGEEFGELTKAVLQMTYEPHKTSHAEVVIEAIQTAAMSLRFLRSLGRYEYAKSEQHSQSAIDAARGRGNG